MSSRVAQGAEAGAAEDVGAGGEVVFGGGGGASGDDDASGVDADDERPGEDEEAVVCHEGVTGGGEVSGVGHAEAVGGCAVTYHGGNSCDLVYYALPGRYSHWIDRSPQRLDKHLVVIRLRFLEIVGDLRSLSGTRKDNTLHNGYVQQLL